MKAKLLLFFWLSAFAIAFLSVIIALHNVSLYSTAASAVGRHLNALKLAFLDRIINHIGVVDKYYSNSVLSDLFSRIFAYHRRKKRKCDDAKWKSKLINAYKVALVLTVDLNGCGQLSSVQKAVDAVPAWSTSKTLIIIDTGTYRLYHISN